MEHGVIPFKFNTPCELFRREVGTQIYFKVFCSNLFFWGGDTIKSNKISYWFNRCTAFFLSTQYRPITESSHLRFHKFLILKPSEGFSLCSYDYNRRFDVRLSDGETKWRHPVNAESRFRNVARCFCKPVL